MITNSLRALKSAKSRFIPLVVMSFLGVFVFAGLQSTQPDMLKTLDQYLDEHEVYDLQVTSTLGLTSSDLENVKKIEGVENVELSSSLDVLVENKGAEKEEYVIRVTSLPTAINQVDLLEGRLPTNKGEIVVEENFLTKTNYKMGNVISLSHDDIEGSSYKIVGTVQSALYFNNASSNQNRGTTSVGTGTINYYAYILDTNFKMEYATTLYLQVKGASSCATSLADYQDVVEKVKTQLEKKKSSFEEERYQTLYNDAKEKIEEEEQNYIKNKSYLPVPVQEETEEKLQEARESLAIMKRPTWYIQDRNDFATYSDYIDDISSIANLSKVFPVVFFAVAILVSLISMNRMVEEDRGEIGTFKSLGFSNRQILLKYVLFSSIATLLGGFLGGILGLYLIPALIASIYGILFDLPYFISQFDMTILLTSLLVSFLCVTGTTCLTVFLVVKEKPSELMRPKAPKAGKRIFLEQISLFWNHLSFSSKVTIRNLFRYKKRGFVTIVGIAGCSALMLCGFGIRDGIVDIASMQYETTFQFDDLVYLKGIEQERLQTLLSDKDVIQQFVPTESKAVEVDKMKGINLVVFENIDEVSKVVTLQNKNEQALSLSKGKVIITDKLADLKHLKVGDTIEMIDTDHTKYTFEISGITKNYLGHYVYIDKESYEQAGYTYQTNLVYLQTKKMTDEEQNTFTKKLISCEEVLHITNREDLMKSAADMLKSLNKVVAILILLAASLSFVVLYNLSNINIEERKREIATLKVLGFYDKEVDRYITRENIFFTVVGIFFGLFFGYFLTKTVISIAEIEKARFLHHIAPLSYFYTIVITVFFTAVVNRVTHFHLKRIDMISSLKSVD